MLATVDQLAKGFREAASEIPTVLHTWSSNLDHQPSYYNSILCKVMIT